MQWEHCKANTSILLTSTINKIPWDIGCHSCSDIVTNAKSIFIYATFSNRSNVGESNRRVTVSTCWDVIDLPILSSGLSNISFATACVVDTRIDNSNDRFSHSENECLEKVPKSGSIRSTKSSYVVWKHATGSVTSIWRDCTPVTCTHCRGITEWWNMGSFYTYANRGAWSLDRRTRSCVQYNFIRSTWTSATEEQKVHIQSILIHRTVSATTN